jgi:HSP90 family molecular chaperone
MVISRKIQGLLPPWASFLRGVLELNDCSPTASREDLVRDEAFTQVQAVLEQKLFEHFEKVAEDDPARIESLLTWHRYTLAGSALQEPRLRQLLRKIYRFPTSRGQLTFDEILAASAADPLLEPEAEAVLWYNSDPRQERWINSLFAGQQAPCVHTLRSFEEQLLGALTADANERGKVTDLRTASPSARNFQCP